MKSYKSLRFNAMLDWRKKDIDKWERAIIIRDYLDEFSLTQRQLAEQLGVPKSTIEDWMLYSRLTKTEYRAMKKKGLSSTDIYKLLRENKQKAKSRFIDVTKLDLEIEECKKKLHPYLRADNGLKLTINSKYSVKELIDVCNRILMKIEKQNGC